SDDWTGGWRPEVTEIWLTLNCECPKRRCARACCVRITAWKDRYLSKRPCVSPSRYLPSVEAECVRRAVQLPNRRRASLWECLTQPRAKHMGRQPIYRPNSSSVELGVYVEAVDPESSHQRNGGAEDHES